jgi:hypothetical protein
MPDINPFTFPSNFFEKVSSKLLTAPRPQLVYAHGLLGALMKSLDVGDLAGSFNGTGHIGGGASIAGAPVPSLEQQALNLYNGVLTQIFETPLEDSFVGIPGTPSTTRPPTRGLLARSATRRPLARFRLA